MCLVSLTVSFDLLHPVGTKVASPSWKLPPVPEVPIDEYDDARCYKYEIRATWKAFDVLSVTKSPRVHNPAYRHFWSRVLAPNPRHRVAALFRRKIIYHDALYWTHAASQNAP